MSKPSVVVRGLNVTYQSSVAAAHVLRDVSLDVSAGQIVALVGESGSGKTTLGLAILGLLPPDGVDSSGSISIVGNDLAEMSGAAVRRMLSRQVGLILQDPTRALNPSMKLRRQLEERGASTERVLERLRECEVPRPEERMSQFPFALSGGIAQRVTVAMALAVGGEAPEVPVLVVADEPTTALDPTTQAQLLRTFSELRDRHHCAMLLITHNLAAAAKLADSLVVMYGGRVCESGPTKAVLADPRHRYTEALLATLPKSHLTGTPLIDIPGDGPTPYDRPAGCPFAARCDSALPICSIEMPRTTSEDRREFSCFNPKQMTATQPRSPDAASLARTDRPRVTVRVADEPDGSSRSPVLHAKHLSKTFPIGGSTATVLSDVSLELAPGEGLVIVGESGCGKTTLLRVLCDLEVPSAGTVAWTVESRPQLIHQNYTAALTPWLTIGSQISERLGIRGVPRRQRANMVRELLRDVGLSSRVADSVPSRLSGGQRQRAVIARALASDPVALLCDEPTSALDASYAVRVVSLLSRLRLERNLATVVVTHDIAVAPYFGSRMLVMKDGRVVERGAALDVVRSPKDPYTASLLEACSFDLTMTSPLPAAIGSDGSGSERKHP